MLCILARITRPHSARKAQPVHLCPSGPAHVSRFVVRKKRARMQFLFHVPVKILQGNRLGKVHTDSGREWISSCRTWLSDSHPRWSRAGQRARITGRRLGGVRRPRQTSIPTARTARARTSSPPGAGLPPSTSACWRDTRKTPQSRDKHKCCEDSLHDRL